MKTKSFTSIFTIVCSTLIGCTIGCTICKVGFCAHRQTQNNNISSSSGPTVSSHQCTAQNYADPLTQCTPLQKQFFKSSNLATGGVIIGSIGLLAATGGIFAVATAQENDYDAESDHVHYDINTGNWNKAIAGMVFIAVGAHLVAGGVTMLVVGNRRKKRLLKKLNSPQQSSQSNTHPFIFGIAPQKRQLALSIGFKF